MSRKQQFNLGRWINLDRGELFFGRRVVFVEGATERVLLSYLAERMGIYDSKVSIIDCGSKFNLRLYMELAGAFKVRHMVIHDEDPVEEGFDGDKLAQARKSYGFNDIIAELAKSTGTDVWVVRPNLEGWIGVSKSQGEKKGKTLAALDHFAVVEPGNFPDELCKLVKRVYER